MGASSVAQRPDGQSDRCPESRSSTDPRATSWAEVVRLRTLPAAVAPVILGGGAALALETFSAPRTILAAGVALALQIGCNLANDYSDGVRGNDWPCDWGSAARGRPSAPCSPSRSLWG